MPEWEPVIGLEIHVQLKTRTKMFCSCEAGYGGEPNTRTCPVCLAFPGALPVPNETAVEWTIKLGHALNCRIAERAIFHRKNYFYPDNPKGYQISRGIEAELRRQIETWESGGEVVQETLDYEVKSDTVTPRRRKEEADDYRYFPEPDLVPLEPETETLERLKSELPELPATRIRRFEHDYGLSYYDAEVLNGSAALAALYERVALDGVDAKAVSNVLMNDFVATGVDPDTVNAGELAKVIAARATIPRSAFAKALAESGDPEFKADTYLGEAVVADSSELEPLVDRVLAANPGQVAAYKGGKEGLLGYFVGQVMKETQGKADPKAVNELLRSKLG